MELCAVNLEQYIHGRPVEMLHEPVFVSDDCSGHIRLLNVWTIGTHITQGLMFIHERNFTHRDLKPANGYF
jgi:serine/threonine protein kinase